VVRLDTALVRKLTALKSFYRAGQQGNGGGGDECRGKSADTGVTYDPHDRSTTSTTQGASQGHRRIGEALDGNALGRGQGR
jgi:hypothetical protein